MSKFTSSPSFCYIAPTKYLDFTKASTTHLVLAHLIIGPHRDQSYVDFYKARSAAGDLVLCDNSAFEFSGSVDPSTLIDAALSVGAKSLVLPDYPNQPAQKTIDAAIEWIPKFKKAGLAPFFVPQSQIGDLDDWLNAYEWGANNPDVEIIGQSILGMPNAIPHIPKSYARVVLTQMLIDRGLFNFNKHHHYLGLQNISLEIPPLLALKALDTCDSSNPIWAGINGFRYDTVSDSYLAISKRYLRDVDFNESIHERALPIVEYNIEVVASMFSS